MLDPSVTSLNVLVYLTNSPKPNDTLFFASSMKKKPPQKFHIWDNKTGWNQNNVI